MRKAAMPRVTYLGHGRLPTYCVAARALGVCHAGIYRGRGRAGVRRTLFGRLAGDRLGLGGGDRIRGAVRRGSSPGLAAWGLAAPVGSGGCRHPTARSELRRGGRADEAVSAVVRVRLAEWDRAGRS